MYPPARCPSLHHNHFWMYLCNHRTMPMVQNVLHCGHKSLPTKSSYEYLFEFLKFQSENSNPLIPYFYIEWFMNLHPSFCFFRKFILTSWTTSSFSTWPWPITTYHHSVLLCLFYSSSYFKNCDQHWESSFVLAEIPWIFLLSWPFLDRQKLSIFWKHFQFRNIRPKISKIINQHWKFQWARTEMLEISCGFIFLTLHSVCDWKIINSNCPYQCLLSISRFSIQNYSMFQFIQREMRLFQLNKDEKMVKNVQTYSFTHHFVSLHFTCLKNQRKKE